MSFHFLNQKKKALLVDIFDAKKEYAVLYYHKEYKATYIKRLNVPNFINNKIYPFVPDQTTLKSIKSVTEHSCVSIEFVSIPRLKIPKTEINIESLPIRTHSTRGTKVTNQEIKRVSVKTIKK